MGPEQIAWLRKDLSRFPATAPIVVFTHRPLFDLKPEWEWFTSDGDEVMKVLAPFENVTVLYGHIHRENVHEEGNVHHYGARGLACAFPDPAQTDDKKAIPFDPAHPSRTWACAWSAPGPGRRPSAATVRPEEVELTMAEHSGTEGFAQLLKPTSL